MDDTAPPLICCFCNGEMPVGPRADEAEESARIAFLDLLPGDELVAFKARERTFFCHLGCFRERLHDPAALLPFEYDENDEEELREKVEDSCGQVAADLMTFGENQPFRDRLYASPAGRWMAVEELCHELAVAQRHLAELNERWLHPVTLMVQHTADPVEPDGEYSLVIFCEPGLLWSTVVLQRRGY
ncbi:MAG TPA: hypothetical protein VFS20_33695 [Longimicrobium sp.]|nr:hypothetical protein [Longimicrobium sp.]